MAFLADMLFAYAFPKDVIVRKCVPLPTHLCCPTQRNSIKVAENAEGNFTRKDGKWVKSSQVEHLLRNLEQLRKAAQLKEAIENEFTLWVRG